MEVEINSVGGWFSAKVLFHIMFTKYFLCREVYGGKLIFVAVKEFDAKKAEYYYREI